MILTADSGSTKCDWILNTKNGAVETNTMGFNPFFHDSELIAKKIQENNTLSEASTQVSEIYFYGAGCSSPHLVKTVEQGLAKAFPNATTIMVDHDLTGAAIATCGDSEGIACILGTGSNSCYFDGKTAHEEVPALAYILGDEGSGAYFGKKMLTDYLYGKFPADLVDDFQDTFSLSKDAIFDAVYRKPHANVYLASFMPFASANKEHKYFKEMMYEGLAKFAHTHIWCFDKFKEVPVHFIGSIAHYFGDVLKDVAKNHRFEIGNIRKKPITYLNEYHINRSLA
jgi:N-acetylglucosamine kinase-like BadF-type ATPase